MHEIYVVPRDDNNLNGMISFTEIGKKAGLFAKLQPGRARKRINAT